MPSFWARSQFSCGSPRAAMLSPTHRFEADTGFCAAVGLDWGLAVVGRAGGWQSAAMHLADGIGSRRSSGAEKGGGPAMSNPTASCEVVTP